MISPRKLRSLPLDTRLRKIVRILSGYEEACLTGDVPDTVYMGSVVEILRETLPELLHGIPETWPLDGSRAPSESARLSGTVRHRILRTMGTEPADWDFHNPTDAGMSRLERDIVPVRVYLEDLRSPFNVGSIFRTAWAFGVEYIHLSADTPAPPHRRVVRSAMGASEAIPWGIAAIEDIALEDNLFALETGGTPVDVFPFPRKGTIIVGSEELGVSPAALEAAKRSIGVVGVPLPGPKASLNVGVAFGIVMQHWYTRLTISES